MIAAIIFGSYNNNGFGGMAETTTTIARENDFSINNNKAMRSLWNTRLQLIIIIIIIIQPSMWSIVPMTIVALELDWTGLDWTAYFNRVIDIARNGTEWNGMEWNGMEWNVNKTRSTSNTMSTGIFRIWFLYVCFGHAKWWFDSFANQTGLVVK